MKINNNSKKLRSLPVLIIMRGKMSLRYFLKSYYRQVGFSLTELMTVVAIIGILASIAVPQYAKYQRKARQTEAKLMLSGIYTSNMSFNAEWGYSTPNLYQMGFSPSGNIIYNVGFRSEIPTSGSKKINDATEANRPTDYDGPPPPPDDGGITGVSLIDTKILCGDLSGTPPGYVSGCAFSPTTLNVDMPNDAEVDNSADKYSPKFVIMAVGHLGGADRDEWKYEIDDSTKTMTNEKSGL